MKSITLLSVAAILLICFSCGDKGKKEGQSTSAREETTPIETSKNSDTDLQQKGDYTLLYEYSESCKLTTAQLAQALGIAESQVTEKSNYKGSCWYDVTSSEKNELIDIQLSESGDTYISRHPAQGFLLLLNPEYKNALKVSYRYFNPEGPKLTEAQREERKENTYRIANYLINQYKI